MSEHVSFVCHGQSLIHVPFSWWSVMYFQTVPLVQHVCVCLSVCFCVRKRRRRRRVAPSPEIGAWGSHIRFRATANPSYVSLCELLHVIFAHILFRRSIWILSSSSSSSSSEFGFLDLLFSASGIVWVADGLRGFATFGNSGNRIRRCAV